MTPSPQQSQIYEHITAKRGHLLVNAKAGTGKTFTISTAARMVLEADPSAKVIFLAFNKAIQQEAEKKLPTAVEVRTCHSKGLQTIKAAHRVQVDNDKVRRIVSETAKEQGWQSECADEQEYVEKVKRIATLCDRMRMTLNRDALAIAARFNIEIEPGEDKVVLDLVQKISNDFATIDMADMVYRPAVYAHYKPETYDYVFVDECQDLSAAQQRFVFKLCKPDGIMVFVGDPGQAIYGFAGADAESFNRLREIPRITELPLSKSFRCAKAIIRYANRYNAEIEAFDTNTEGSVNEKALVSEITSGDMVLCRTTMPLVSLCYKLIGEGQKAFVRGRDVGEGIVSFVTKSKIRNFTILDVWMNGQVHKLRAKLQKMHPHIDADGIAEKPSYVALVEQIAIIRTVIAANPEIMDVDGVVRRIREIFTDNDGEGVALSTIHKAKGLEAKRVFVIEWNKMPLKSAKQDWELLQETNLQYVAVTRAKEYFGIITDWKADEQAPDNLSELVQAAVNPFQKNIRELF